MSQMPTPPNGKHSDLQIAPGFFARKTEALLGQGDCSRSDHVDPRIWFLAWEQASDDTIDFKKVYVDMADDLIAGLLLSQIVYWHLPDKKGRDTKMRVWHDGELWIAKARHEWWDEVRMTPRARAKSDESIKD